ncbi:hypothetical protein CY35_15G008500 [Sphagnum magellanicum]|nr:hypothetical protein CY35_15G008500 [Sphagnum magellanicum]
MPEAGILYEYGSSRLENWAQLEANIASAKPSHVFNATGVTGRPNVEWCESHKVETIRANIVGTLTLVDVCKQNNLLLINFEHDNTPNFVGSYYSNTKIKWGPVKKVEELLKEFDNNPRNFITKISRYQKMVNTPNNMTILDELLPISIEMAKRNLRGIWNFANPGVVNHNEILEMYRQYIKPGFSWKNFTLEEQAKVIIAPWSNNELHASKLQGEFPEDLPIKESLIKYVFEPNRQATVE